MPTVVQMTLTGDSKTTELEDEVSKLRSSVLSLESTVHSQAREIVHLRTRQAIDAIESQNWNVACEAMLEYYDSCYDRELERSPARSSVNLQGLTSEQAARLLLDQGHVIPGISN